MWAKCVEDFIRHTVAKDFEVDSRVCVHFRPISWEVCVSVRFLTDGSWSYLNTVEILNSYFTYWTELVYMWEQDDILLSKNVLKSVGTVDTNTFND